MMHMLEAGGMPILTDNIRKADPNNPNGYYEFEPVKQMSRDASWLMDADGKAVKMVYRLLYDLPKDHNYRVIFMERELEEVLASQRMMLRWRGEEHGTSDDTQLAKLFHRDLEQNKGWLHDQENFRVLYVSYNNILNDPESAAIEINRFLGSSLDPQAMLKVVDQGLYRQRR
jgi:hypothetical protein